MCRSMRCSSDAYAARRRALIDPAQRLAGNAARRHAAELGLPPRAAADRRRRRSICGTRARHILRLCHRSARQLRSPPRPAMARSTAPIIPGTGIAPSSRGMQSWTDPSHPACLAPGKRPRLTPSPAIARRDGQVDHAVRHPGQRRAAAGDAAGVPQPGGVRHDAAGRRSSSRVLPPPAFPAHPIRTATRRDA